VWHFWLTSNTTQSLILWFTAIAVVLYTKETYDLKKLAREDLDMARETQRSEFLPILVPVAGNSIVQGESFKFRVNNEGKGIARDVEIWMHGITLMKGDTITAGSKDHYLIGIHPNLKLITERDKPAEMDAELLYKDVYGRHFRTIGLKWRRDSKDPGNRYFLDTNSWAFKKRS
jgi:hypothetical protein